MSVMCMIGSVTNSSRVVVADEEIKVGDTLNNVVLV
jgi:hypothetical protein